MTAKEELLAQEEPVAREEPLAQEPLVHKELLMLSVQELQIIKLTFSELLGICESGHSS